MSEGWRCFVAVLLDDDLRARLAEAVSAWRADPRTDGLRWVAPDAFHLTLAFLGDIDPARVPAISTAVREAAARFEPASVVTGRLGAFARPSSARVLWYGIGDAHGMLRALASELAVRLELRVDAEQYRPHVTLARARRGWVDLRGWIEEASASAPEGTLAISEIELMRSHLGRGPARYERLASVQLGSGARG